MQHRWRQNMDESNNIHCSHTIAGHAGAAAVVAQDRMDPLADRLGSVVLAPIRASEFSFLLRSRKCVDRNRFGVGGPAVFFWGARGLLCFPSNIFWGPNRMVTGVGGFSFMSNMPCQAGLFYCSTWLPYPCWFTCPRIC